jgi:hypothetical protein
MVIARDQQVSAVLAGPGSEPSWAARDGPTRVRCMHGMLSGVLLTAAFAAVAGFALVMLVRLLWISRPAGRKARAGD